MHHWNRKEQNMIKWYFRNLQRDRQKNKFTEVKHVSPPVGDCWSQKRGKKISKVTFLGNHICSIIAYIKKFLTERVGR